MCFFFKEAVLTSEHNDRKRFRKDLRDHAVCAPFPSEGDLLVMELFKSLRTNMIPKVGGISAACCINREMKHIYVSMCL